MFLLFPAVFQTLETVNKSYQTTYHKKKTMYDHLLFSEKPAPFDILTLPSSGCDAVLLQPCARKTLNRKSEVTLSQL